MKKAWFIWRAVWWPVVEEDIVIFHSFLILIVAGHVDLTKHLSSLVHYACREFLFGHASNSTQILRPKSDWRPILGLIRGRESVPPVNFRSRGNPPVSPLAAGPKIAWGHTFPASDRLQNWSPIRFWPKNLCEVWSVTTQKFSAGLLHVMSLQDC